MNSLQLIEQIDILKKVLKKGETKKLLNWLNLLKNKNATLQKLIGNTLVSHKDAALASRLEETKAYITQMIETVKTDMRPKLFFKIIAQVQNDYSLFVKNVNPDENLEIYVNSHFSKLEEAYENFIINYSYEATVQLISSAITFLNFIEAIDKTTNAISQSLQKSYDYDADDTLKSLSLVLDSDYTFQEFVNKLDAIQSLYSEICFLFNVSEIDFPLRIAKVESGSLWVKLFGESKVIEFILSLIKDGKDYGYRNKTTEGKIESVQQKFKAVEAALEIRKKMQEAGINVDDLDESIKKSSIIIVENLNKILASEGKIILNGELIEPVDKTQKLLKGGDKYLLEGSKDSTEDSK
jgi:chaperonin cofactor prefoldin